jgi:hypothetical protein
VALPRTSRKNVRKTLKKVKGRILKKPRRSLSEEYVDQRVSVVALKLAELVGKKLRLQRTEKAISYHVLNYSIKHYFNMNIDPV